MSRETIRTFLAVELPGEARAQARSAIDALRPCVLGPPESVRWIPVENLHLTLKFLGSIDPDQVPRLLSGAAAKLAGEEPFEVELGGLGAFPNARKARVLWLGVSRGAAQLARLARKLDAAARRIGVSRERRAFHAHLTLGRMRQPGGGVALERARAPEGRPFQVEEVVLFESRLAPTGATYVPLARLPLRPIEGDEDAVVPDHELAPEI
jgi:2'-5' RNA ligase